MKFVLFKKSLEIKLKQAYLITGEDRYVCFQALEILKKKLNLNFPELNSVTFAGEDVPVDNIINACEVLPFNDSYRLVIVKELQVKRTAEYFESLKNYLKKPCETTVLVLFYPEQNEVCKKLESNLNVIECDRLDDPTLSAWALNYLNKRNVTITTNAIEKLIAFTSGSLTRISTELEKLSNYIGEGGIINELTIEDNVVKDREYQVFELCSEISHGTVERAIDMLSVLVDSEKSAFSILTVLYNYFRRLLYIKITPMTVSEYAEALGIKEFAVKKLIADKECFGPKNIKKIMELLTSVDLKIKNGTMKENIAVKYAVLQILQMRK